MEIHPTWTRIAWPEPRRILKIATLRRSLRNVLRLWTFCLSALAPAWALPISIQLHTILTDAISGHTKPYTTCLCACTAITKITEGKIEIGLHAWMENQALERAAVHALSITDTKTRRKKEEKRRPSSRTLHAHFTRRSKEAVVLSVHHHWLLPSPSSPPFLSFVCPAIKLTLRPR